MYKNPEDKKAQAKRWREANKEYMRQWHRNNPNYYTEWARVNKERIAANARERWEALKADPTRHKEYTERCRVRRAARRARMTPEQRKALSRASNLRKMYGMTVADYDALLVKQGGMCPICLRPLSDVPGNTHVDHCHTTGRVRGILHPGCNLLLGLSGDDADCLMRAIRYLNEFNSGTKIPNPI